MNDESVSLTLTRDEALVLFEWLARRGASEAEFVNVEKQPEELVLWAIEGQLEKTLVEAFAPNYDQLLQEARKRILTSR